MKGMIVKGLTLATCAMMAFSAYANKDMMMHKAMKMKWTCETNASSASTDMDKKADEDMAKMPKMGAAAFAMAMKHCRDCTKITCTMEDKEMMKD